VRIILIGTLPPIKGISPYCQELLNAISKICDVEFIGFDKIYPEFLYPGSTKVEGPCEKIHSTDNINIRNFLTYYNPFSWIWAGISGNGDVVHAQWWTHFLFPMYFSILSIFKIRGKRIVITVHNVLPHEASKISLFLNKIVYSFGDRFIVHTANNVDVLSKIYSIPREKIDVIPHGILKPLSNAGISKRGARVSLSIPYNARVILHFGNIRDYKGLDILLESLPEIVKCIPNARLIIAGKPWSDWEMYERIIEERGLGRCVKTKLDFVPPSEVELFFAAADLVVLPYKYFDSQSGVGALALPFMKPLIVTNVGGLPDFVKDERAIAKPNDAKDLAAKIISVLSDEALIQKLAKDSEDLAKDYGWDGIGDRTVRLYTRCAES